MGKKKRLGRPPAEWMFKVVELNLDDAWTDPYEISNRFSLNVNTVKSFFEKLKLKPKYEVENGTVRARFRVSDFKRAAAAHVEPWL